MNSKGKKKVVRTERGWAGHFCASRDCTFRRNTLLQCGQRRVVVSTVGNYRPPKVSEGFGGKVEEIGLNRYYETMAFKAKKDGVYWEADTKKPVGFSGKWSIRTFNHDADAEANDMHEAAVASLTGWLQAGGRWR